MNGKERLLAAMAGHPVDRPPVFYMGTPAISEAVVQALSTPDSVAAPGGLARETDAALALGADVVFVRPRFVPGEGRTGGFRTAEVHARMHQEPGHEDLVIPPAPLATAESADDIYSFPAWPDAGWFDYDLPDDQRKLARTHGAVARGNNAMFLSASALRGMEGILVDMAIAPEIAASIFARITDFNVSKLERFLERNADLVDAVDIGDDIAGQNGMLFSVGMYRQFVAPQLARLADVAQRYGKEPVFFGCGGFRDVLPEMISAGIHNVGRMQTEASGNELTRLVRDFGDTAVLWGALDAQHALIEQDPDGAAAHVHEVLSVTSGHRYVAGPTHTFTADTPVDNVLACYRALGTM